MKGKTERGGGRGEGVDDIVEWLKHKHNEDASFVYSIQTHEEEDSIPQAIFWADSSSRMNYASFGDTVIFHKSSTLYKNLPFFSFTGLNHHGHPLLFGSGLFLTTSPTLSSISQFLHSWLHSMPGPPPLSLTTPLHPLLQSSIPLLLPHTRHLISIPSILEKTRAKLPKTYLLHPSFESDFTRCVSHGGTVEEFESLWGFLLEKYNLVGNQWLASVYGVRPQWVPVFVKGAFLGAGSRKNMSFFQGCIDPETTTITKFGILIKKCEEAAEYWKGEEMKADYETSTTMPKLETSSPMEEQAAIVYTRHAFFMFQRELVGSVGDMAVGVGGGDECVVYKVTELGEDGGVHTVRLITEAGTKPRCSCLVFESSGVVCRHMLAVFRANNVECIPPHCILRRWSRNGRGGVSDDSFQTWNYAQQLSDVRYDHLWKAASKYVDEGARSVSVYGVAMEVLREAIEGVSSVNNSEFCVKHCGSLGNGGGSPKAHYGSEDKRESYPSRGEKEKKLQELRFELKKVNRRCEVYRENLAYALKSTQEESVKLFVKMQNARLSLKE